MRKMILLLGIMMLMLTIVSAQEVLTEKIPTAIRGNCINLVITCDNCTYMNITKVVAPSSTILFSGNGAMTKAGNDFNTTFCNTQAVGFYEWFYKGDLNGQTVSDSSPFKISRTGETDDANLIPIVILALGILAFARFFIYKRNKLFGNVVFMLVGAGLLLKTSDFLFFSILIFVVGLISLLMDLMGMGK